MVSWNARLRTRLSAGMAVLCTVGVLWSISTGAPPSALLLWIGLTGYAFANTVRTRLPAGGRFVYLAVGGLGLATLALGVEKVGARMTAAVFALVGAGTAVDLVLLRLGVSWNQLG